MWQPAVQFRRAALSLAFIGGLAGGLGGAAPALAAGPPTIVDAGSMAPWIVKVAGSNFTPGGYVKVEVTDIATGWIWVTYPFPRASVPLCLSPVNSPNKGLCTSGGSFTYSLSPNLNCVPLGRDVTAWDFASQQWSNTIHLGC
jgi:hypothetical protein